MLYLPILPFACEPCPDFGGDFMNKALHALPGPDDVTRVTLDNGITVLVRENHTAPVVVLEGSLATGSIHDPLGKSGISSFTASMMTRGSQKYDFARFNETIESVGASLAVSSELEQFNFGINSLSEDFPTMLDVLSDVLRTPTFPDDQFELLRRRRLVHLQEREQDTASVANLRFYETIYGDHPYGRAVSGYIESINALKRSDLFDFYQQRITPDGAVIVITGDVQTQNVIDLLQQQLGDWRGPSSDRTVPALPAFTGVRRIDAAMKDKVQSDIVLGFRTHSRTHPDYYKTRVANCILGVFGMMGRLGEVVREQQGLAYYSYSSVDVGKVGGVWMASAGVGPDNTQQAVDSILTEFARIASQPVTQAELSDSQAYLTGALPLTLETNSGVASILLDMEWLNLGLDFLHRYRDLINIVTVEDVLQVAQEYLRTDVYALVVAGPR